MKKLEKEYILHALLYFRPIIDVFKMTAGTRSSDLSQIAVSSNNIPNGSVDCGIKLFGCCNGPQCLKMAQLRTFVLALTFAGLVQGICETYFRISAKEAALENGYNPIIVEWLIVSSGIFQALFALVFAHWALKMHPIKWLSVTIIAQSIICVIAAIPAIIGFSNGVSTPTSKADAIVCTTTTFQSLTLTAQQTQLSTLILLFVLQFALGFGSLAFYTIGVSYLDDNSQSIDSPAVIATALAGRIFGLQVGSFVVIGVGVAKLGWWLGWIIIAPLVLISGILLSLFPKRLPKTVIHQAAQRIIEETHTRTFGSQFSTYIDDVGFGPSLKRLFTNKLLMCNLLGIVFIWSAYVNFELQEESYLQSRFFLPYSEQDGLLQEWEARFVAYFLRPPVAATGTLVLGLIIAKLKLTGRTITAVNIALGVHLLAIFIGNIFIKCDVGAIAGVTNGKVLQPFCSRQCTGVCQSTTFQPICPENSTVTYFSACYAGCSRTTTINNLQIYEGCTCSSNSNAEPQGNLRATEGACSFANCQRMLIGFQVLSLSAAAVVGASAIGKVIITLRSVLPQDKALALATQLTLFGIFAYIPTHIAYEMVTRYTCLYWTSEYNRCLLRETPKHGNILNILSAVLILIGILFDILVYIFVKDLNVYNCKAIDPNYSPSLYSPIPHEEPQATGVQPAVGGSPATTLTTDSPMRRRDSQPTRPAPKTEITVFRNPSSLTNSSAGENSVQETNNNNTVVTYAQVVFPPDKHKSDDGTTSPKRMAVRADVPLHHLSAQDVRAQLGNLKSFNIESAVDDDGGKQEEQEAEEKTPLTLNITAASEDPAKKPVTPIAGVKVLPPIAPKPMKLATTPATTAIETNLDKIEEVPSRPLSPETDL
ncbi:PREDICTED: solute carrier organic anion transporter family member 1A5 isoform X1 [Rhagoletis zephyria]|uniref:solute carrier organic anion transporter family member 1A5 isoform X1 n=3 Tax=Rhagoletis zephyria TaxID=28612 RepID=UPI0008119643|nr:PREDICTED: solute carrier organic anion transporter family member 1A5 isoform X1 [Rhagoletis zephyria]